jgi:hypothetical protein
MFGIDTLPGLRQAMNELIFHEPWLLLATVAVAGIVTFVIGNRRLDKPLQRIGLAAVLLALLLGGLRYFFPTPREQMEIRTRKLVRAVNDHDWNAVNGLIDTDTVIGSRDVVYKAGRDAIDAMVQTNVEAFKVSSVHIMSMESVQTDTMITISLEVYSVQDATDDRPETSSWQLDFEQSGDQWLLEKFTLLRIGGEGEAQNFKPLMY